MGARAPAWWNPQGAPTTPVPYGYPDQAPPLCDQHPITVDRTAMHIRRHLVACITKSGPPDPSVGPSAHVRARLQENDSQQASVIPYITAAQAAYMVVVRDVLATGRTISAPTTAGSGASWPSSHPGADAGHVRDHPGGRGRCRTTRSEWRRRHPGTARLAGPGEPGPLHVVKLPSPTERLAFLADQLPNLDGSGIVYILTVAAADEIAAFLRDRGFPVAAYSGRTEDAERRPDRGRPTGQPDQSPGRHLRARHGLRQARPRLGWRSWFRAQPCSVLGRQRSKSSYSLGQCRRDQTGPSSSSSSTCAGSAPMSALRRQWMT